MPAQEHSGIIRTRRDRNNPYAMVNKAPFEDERLSWEARGVLAYLLTKPDDWQVRTADLLKRAPKCGIDRLTRILKELEDAGYLVRERRNVGRGRFEWITTVFENPIDAQEVREKTGKRRRKTSTPLPGNPVMAEPQQEAQSTITGFAINGPAINGKPGHIVNTDLTISSTNVEESAVRKKRTRTAPKEEPTPAIIRTTLADVCGYDMEVCSKEKKLQVNTTAKRLFENGEKAGKGAEEIAATIRYVFDYFNRNDWRGKKGDRPTPKDLVDIWGAAIAARNGHAPGYQVPPTVAAARQPQQPSTPAPSLREKLEARQKAHEGK